ncbi:helix-turn-helix transcriptional regulator [uncultured Kocuria sp.]|uniref:helix-turn-helix transcriptional regulator n=1 Tax=uncultured Kocuria sp. TaxID=259305 RepID=UPI0026109A87|nr:helix-turn-helix transcriptional regulator [uncultured Kocuria sp.]
MGEVFRHELIVSDPEVLPALGERTGMRFGYSSADPGFSYRLSRAGDEQLAVSSVHVGGTMSLWGDTEVFTVAHVRGIRYDWQIRAETGTAAAGSSVLFRPDHPSLVVAQDVDVTMAHLPVPLVQATADTVYGAETPVGFTASAPVSARLGEYWSGLVRLGAEVLGTPAFDEPMVRADLTRRLAVGLLECFPLLGDREERYLSMEAQAHRYRVAAQFFDDHASDPITVEDAARAARTTTKNLVQAFRANHPLALTPAQYLRRTRMDAAHRDLQDGDPARGDTVKGIAARWGFTHPGRFAQYYRQLYGTTPSRTLDR